MERDDWSTRTRKINERTNCLLIMLIRTVQFENIAIMPCNLSTQVHVSFVVKRRNTKTNEKQLEDNTFILQISCSFMRLINNKNPTSIYTIMLIFHYVDTSLSAFFMQQPKHTIKTASIHLKLALMAINSRNPSRHLFDCQLLFCANKNGTLDIDEVC